AGPAGAPGGCRAGAAGGRSGAGCNRAAAAREAGRRMGALTTRVLDTARGRPAGGVAITVHRSSDGGWILVGQGVTDADGRCRNLLAPDVPLAAGRYRPCFETGAWFDPEGPGAFQPKWILPF